MPNKHLANSLFLAALKGSVSPLSKKSISHENLNIKDIIHYKQQGFSIGSVSLSDFHHNFLLHLKASEYFNHYNIMKSPTLTL